MTTRVKFKCETFVGTEPAGPVTIIDVEAYEADPVVAGRRARCEPGLPYGYEPSGVQVLERWLTRSEALAVAEEHGVELDEGSVAHS